MPTLTHGCCMARRTSLSSMRKYTAPMLLWSATTRSISVSIGSLFCIFERGHLFVGLVANMAGVNAAFPRGHFGHGDELVSLRVKRRRVDQGSGEAHGAVVHRVFHHQSHGLEFVGGGRTIVIADHVFA